MNQQPINLNYVVANAEAPSTPFVEMFSARNPTPNDINYPIQKRWFNTVLNQEYLLVGFTSMGGVLQAIWRNISTGGNILQVAVPNGTSPIQPDVTGTITFTSNDATVTITGSSSSPNNNFIDFSAAAGASGIQHIITDTGAGTPLQGATINLNSTVPYATSTGPNSLKVTATTNTQGLIALQLAGSNAGSSTPNNFGIAQFDSNQFNVIGGFVQMKGGGTQPTLGLTPDAHTAPGTTPVVPNGSGNIILEGGVLFNTGTQANPIRTNSLAANTLDLQIQEAGSNPASSTPNNFGVAQFDGNQFTVTSGFVQLKGGGTTGAILNIPVPLGASPVFPTSSGVLSFTSTGGSVNITGGANTINFDISGGGAPLETLSDDVGTSVTPSANNIQLVGHVVEQGATKFSTVVAGSHLLNINPMSSARWIVDPLGFNGTHTTIASAITSATSGDTIFLMPGTYTTNLTLKAGVNLAAWPCDSSLNGTGNVQITGKLTFTGAGTVTISGIQLNTNSDFFLAVTGSAASIVNLVGCYLNCSNNTGISYSSSSASSNVALYECHGDIGTTGITLYSNSSAGRLDIEYTEMTNSGNSTTASNSSAGGTQARFCTLLFPMSTSSTGLLNLRWIIIFLSGTNTTCVTTAGNQNQTFHHCRFSSGSASAISVGAGTQVTLMSSCVESSAGNAIAGSGTLKYGGIVWTTSSTIAGTLTATLLTVT